MKALSVKSVYAEQIADGEKTIELRSYPINHRGPLLICSTQPAGVMVCIVEVVDCRPFRPQDAQAALSKYRPGLFAWVLANPRRVMPAPVRGQQSIYHIDDSLIHPVD